MSPSMHGYFECSQTSAWDGCAKHRTMTPDRPTGPATAADTLRRAFIGSDRIDWQDKTPIQTLDNALADERAAERARIFAALPAALASVPREGAPCGDHYIWSEMPDAAALVAAIEKELR